MKARSLFAAVIVLSLLLPLGVGAASTPLWMQSNADGFGDVDNVTVLSLAPFDDQLYAGTGNQNGSQIWRLGNSGWVSVMGDGFGDADNTGIDHLIQFGGHLYAGTWNEVDGGEVWRSSDGSSWSRVVSGGFGDSTNAEVFRFIEFNNQLYASTWSYTSAHGSEIWRTSTGNIGEWTRVVSSGFGDAGNAGVTALNEFNGYLYAGTAFNPTGGEVWRSNDGTSWAQVNTDGFGDVHSVTAMADFDSYLYASTFASTVSADIGGATIWRCQTCDGTDWTKLVDNGFGNGDVRGMGSLEVFHNALYFVVGSSPAAIGMSVWRTAEGTAWEQVGFSGFSDTNNLAPYWDNSVAVFNNRLFVGTWNPVTGGEVWEKGRFDDVNFNHWAYSFIEAIAAAGLTAGYPDGTYGPDNPVTRAEMAVFLKKGIHGSSYTPPSPDGSHPFSDISGHWAEAWMEELYDEGLTSGYPDGTYRPENRVSRAEMAVFLLKAMHGSGYTPPAPAGGSFSDVAGHWAEAWIEQLKEEGITSGYPDGTYRPENQVTRAEMAVFLVNAFSLPLP